MESKILKKNNHCGLNGRKTIKISKFRQVYIGFEKNNALIVAI